MIKYSFALAFALLAVPLASGAQTAPTDTNNGSVMSGLRPGDLVRVMVWRKPELSGDFAVAADGSLTHPLYREVKVTEVPLPVVEERIRAFLGRFEANPSVVIAPLFRVAVGGEVREPSLYSLPPETTIAQAVAMAGGPTDRGSLDKVRILRGGQVLRIDLTRPDRAAFQQRVASGDQIFVLRRRMSIGQAIGTASSITAAVLSAVALAIQLSK